MDERAGWDQSGSISRQVVRALALALLSFRMRYRRTVLGPLWLLIGPSLFIVTLGYLYADIGAVKPSVFIPHMAVGLVVWTLIQGFITGATTVYERGRAQIMQPGSSLDDIALVDVLITSLTFVHQLPIVIIVFLIYGVPLHASAWLSLVGLALILVNGIWFTRLFGILGARYRDLSEVFQAIVRIAFLATPIVWMPGDVVRGSTMTKFLLLNPFYHFIEVVRAPLLGDDVYAVSWIVVVVVTVVGYFLARYANARFARLVPLWV